MDKPAKVFSDYQRRSAHVDGNIANNGLFKDTIGRIAPRQPCDNQWSVGAGLNGVTATTPHLREARLATSRVTS